MAEAEEVVDTVAIEFEHMVGKRTQRIDLGCKRQSTILLGYEQGLDPDRIASERQAPLELVPDGDGIHALEPRPGIVSPAEVSGEDGLCIAVVGLEGAAPLEFATKFGMIEYLAVENDRVARVGAEDGLVPAFHVDDAEPAHSEAEIAVGEIAGVIGTAMANGIAGSGEHALRHRLAAASVPPRNSAHLVFPGLAA